MSRSYTSSPLHLHRCVMGLLYFYRFWNKRVVEMCGRSHVSCKHGRQCTVNAGGCSYYVRQSDILLKSVWKFSGRERARCLRTSHVLTGKLVMSLKQTRPNTFLFNSSSGIIVVAAMENLYRVLSCLLFIDQQSSYERARFEVYTAVNMMAKFVVWFRTVS
jgi:hypothetical protein